MTTSDSPQSATSKMCLVCQKHFDSSFSICPHDQSNLVRIGQEDTFIGKVISGKYKIVEKIGQGGMGTVFLVDHLELRSQMALKMLKAQLSEDKNSVARFEVEAQTSASLKHPNLITLYDYGTFEGKQPYLVMEYLQGESLSAVIKREGPLSPERALHIFSQVADGLHYAHQTGVVHRDVKPSNIILLEENGKDVVKVVDFGLAKLMPWSGKESQHLTKTGEVFGSPIYMSPEQCMGKRLEPSSDIYSLGITLFEALIGRPPFKGKNVVETASQHMNAAPPTFDSFRPDLNLSENLQAVIWKSLEKEPINRYLSLNDFKNALTQSITGPGANGGIRTGPPPVYAADATQPVKRSDLENYKPSTSSHKTTDTLRKASSKKAVNPAVIGGAVAFVAIAGGAGWFLTQKKEPASGSTTSSSAGSEPGTITYISNKEVHVVDSNGKVHPFTKNLPDLHIKVAASCNFTGTEIKDMKRKSKVMVLLSLRCLERLLLYLSQYNDAPKDNKDNYASLLTADAKGNILSKVPNLVPIQNYKPIGSFRSLGKDSQNMMPLDNDQLDDPFKNESVMRLLSSIKFVQVLNDRAELLVKMQAVPFNEKNPAAKDVYCRFIFSPIQPAQREAQIADIEPATVEDWSKY